MMAGRALWLVVPSILPLAVGGCADKLLDASGSASTGQACALEGEDDCGEGLACEPVLGSEDEHVCAERVEIHGRVIDALSQGPLEGALVVAADEVGAPVTTVVATDADGRYVLPVSVGRDAAGELAEDPRWTLLVSAADHLSFPGALRPALPLGVEEGAAIIDNPATTVALVPLADASGVVLRGRVEGERAAGTLVVAEGPEPAPIAVADREGAFTLFDVPAGSVTVRGYRGGVELSSVALTIAAADLEDVRLTVVTDDAGAMAVVRGSVNLVDAAGGRATSVVLVPSSVYHEAFERGPVPLGLRAPAPPEAPSISSSFEIAGVPAGRYRVLAAFENDGLVRDPDASISGTQILEVEVEAGQPIDLAESFKITNALAVVGPGSEALEEVEGAPTLEWTDDASENRYEVVVYDALGTEIWRDAEVPGVAGEGGVVQLPYGGPALATGMLHQFRVTSWRDGPQGSTALSRTEDLRGVFVVR